VRAAVAEDADGVGVEELAQLYRQGTHAASGSLAGPGILGLGDDGVDELADAVDLHAHDVADHEQSLGNGWRTAPIPAGVPVAMTSPGSSVNASDR
jgi:hypothetical protein